MGCKIITNPGEHSVYQAGLTHSYRGVFAELTQRGEGLFVGFPDSVNHLLCVWAQRVALCAFLLFIFFLLLIPVVPYRCTDRKTTQISADCTDS